MMFLFDRSDFLRSKYAGTVLYVMLILTFLVGLLTQIIGCFRPIGYEEGWVFYLIRDQLAIHISLYNFYFTHFCDLNIVYFRFFTFPLLFLGSFLFAYGLYRYFKSAFFLQREQVKYLFLATCIGYLTFRLPTSMAITYLEMISFIFFAGSGLLLYGLSSESKYPNVALFLAGITFSQVLFIQPPGAIFALVPYSLLFLHKRYKGTVVFTLGGLFGILLFFGLVFDFYRYIEFLSGQIQTTLHPQSGAEDIHSVNIILRRWTEAFWILSKEFILAGMFFYAVHSFRVLRRAPVVIFFLVLVLWDFIDYMDLENRIIAKGSGEIFFEAQSFLPVIFSSFFLLWCFLYKRIRKDWFSTWIAKEGKSESRNLSPSVYDSNVISCLSWRQITVLAAFLVGHPLIFTGSFPQYIIACARYSGLFYVIALLFLFGIRNTLFESDQKNGSDNEHRAESELLSHRAQSFFPDVKSFLDCSMIWYSFLLFISIIVISSYFWLPAWATRTSILEETCNVKKFGLSPSLFCSEREGECFEFFDPYIRKAKVLTGEGYYGFIWPYVILYGKKSLCPEQGYNFWTKDDFLREIKKQKLIPSDLLILIGERHWYFYNDIIRNRDRLDEIAQQLGASGWERRNSPLGVSLIRFLDQDSRQGASEDDELYDKKKERQF